MDEMELLWLATMAAKSPLIVEVGSWKGRSTVCLGENTKGVVFAVDSWMGSAECWVGAYSNLGEEYKGPDGLLFREFRNNTRHLPVVPVERLSVDAAHMFAASGMAFDMIFIDGSHDYENVKADIEAWRPLIKKGGIFCGHDYGMWPDVEKAVMDCLEGIHVPVGSIWEWR